MSAPPKRRCPHSAIPGNGSHVFAGAGFGAQIAIKPGDLAGRKRGAWQPGTGEAFEDVVVDAADLFIGGNGLGGPRIEDHEIGVGTNRDRALARIDVEDARNIRRLDGVEIC
jgi:hypothetical protein